MEVIKTDIEGLFVVEPTVFGDNRGWFFETYTKSRYESFGLCAEFVQDNQSYSKEKGTIRGLHFQKNPMAQTKLIRCTRGVIRDVVVDLRKASPTYKKWFAIELSPENQKQLWIPRGFGHGFVTLTADCEIQYKVDNYYSKECDRSVRFDDPAIGVDWGIESPILSEKDKNAPLLCDSDVDF